MRPAARGLRQRRSPGLGEEQEEQGTEGQQESQQQQAAPGLHTPHFTTSADLEASYGKPGSPTEAAEGASPNGERLGSKGGRVGRGAATAMPAASERCCPGCLRSQQLPFLLLPRNHPTGSPSLQAVGVEGDALDQLTEQQAAAAAAAAANAQPPPRPPAPAAAAAEAAGAGVAAAAGEEDALDSMMR